MCTYPFAKGALTLHLARREGHERNFDCNLMHRKVLASSYQHLMAEAPIDIATRCVCIGGITSDPKRGVDEAGGKKPH